jgi:spermidine synthase
MASWHIEEVTNGVLVNYSLTEGGCDVIWVTKKAKMELLDTVAYGKMLLIDGELQSTERDEYIYHEMLVHPLASVIEGGGGPRRVKIYGGGEGATAREVLKWSSVRRVVQVDWDDELLTHFRSIWKGWACGAYEDPRLELRVADAWVDCCEDEEKYDYIIIDLPDPDDLDKFRDLLKGVVRQLAPGGAFVMNAGPVQPWDGGFAATFCKDFFEMLPQSEWQPYSWHTNVPSFAAAGEWCFLGAVHSDSGYDSESSDSDSGCDSSSGSKVAPPTGLRRFSERVWKYARYWPDDYPEVLASVSY